MIIESTKTTYFSVSSTISAASVSSSVHPANTWRSASSRCGRGPPRTLPHSDRGRWPLLCSVPPRGIWAGYTSSGRQWTFLRMGNKQREHEVMQFRGNYTCALVSSRRESTRSLYYSQSKVSATTCCIDLSSSLSPAPTAAAGQVALQLLVQPSRRRSN